MSARRFAIGIFLGVAIIAGALAANLHQYTGRPSYITEPLQLHDRTITLDVADTNAKQELGLGHRTSLASNKGMVFPYAKEQQLCFWMKDMRFPIDMIWLDSSKKVTHIEANVSPDSYPKTFCADKPSQYVVELNANLAKQAGIQDGQQLKF